MKSIYAMLFDKNILWILEKKLPVMIFGTIGMRSRLYFLLEFYKISGIIISNRNLVNRDLNKMEAQICS